MKIDHNAIVHSAASFLQLSTKLSMASRSVNFKRDRLQKDMFHNTIRPFLLTSFTFVLAFQLRTPKYALCID